MAWTDVYPVFDEDLVDQYDKEATEAEKAEMRELYEVAEIHNAQAKSHIVSYSLFWKPVKLEDDPYPTPSREVLENAVELGHAPRYDPWEHYVVPLLLNVPELKKKYPDIVFRVHLASDLNFLIPDLIEAGCEVYLMRHSSLAFAPGGLWRFLPIGEEGKLVTVCDIDRMEFLETDIERTMHMAQAQLGVWKVPVWMDINGEGEVCYLPFVGTQSGWRGGLPVQELLESFTWQSQRGNIPLDADIPGCGPLPVTKTTWPDYGFDEWFLAVAIFPRVAQDGILNFIPTIAGSMLCTLDVEYSTWANPESEVVFFPVGGNCC